MQLKEALETNNKDYRIYLYRMGSNGIESEIFNAKDGEKAINEGWAMSPADVMPEEEFKKAALGATEGFDMTEEAKEKVFKEMVIDNSVIANRLLNFDELNDLEVIKDLVDPLQYKGEPLSDKINWNIKGKRKLEHIKRDVRKLLVEMGLIDDNSKGDN